MKKHVIYRFLGLMLVAFILQRCELLEEGFAPDEPTGNFVQTGIASYYADKFDGNLTASGEVFDQDKLTAAHKHLPFGTMVKVVNLENGKEIEVKINDRGPFVSGRIIDVSKRGAEELGFVQQGLVDVRIEAELPESVADSLNTKLGLPN